ncbi:MAG: S8 family peptidase, partial [Chloroflexota bacterium]
MVYREANIIDQNFKSRYWLLAGIVMMAAMLVMQPAVSSPDSKVAAASLEVQSYIVQGENTEAVKRLIEAQSGVVTSELHIINGAGAMLTEEAAVLLSEMDDVTVTPNHEVVTIQSIDNVSGVAMASGWTPSADYSEAIGANDVWAEGVTGDNVTVAILDTGIDPSLPGLAYDTEGNERLILDEGANFVEEDSLPLDDHGHGTHVAGIVANSEIGADGNWNGVAPDATLLPVRVLDNTGFGSYETVIEGIQYVVDNRKEYKVKVINLSIVSSVQSPYWADPLNQAVTTAWSKGITVVAAAGNSGSDAMTISVPGNNPYVITVGAFTDNFTPYDMSDDYIAPFSAAGPTLDGFVKPDVVAPGAHIYSTMSPGTTLAETYPEDFVEPNYFTTAGTSQSTAVTTGVIALMLDNNKQEKKAANKAIRQWNKGVEKGEIDPEVTAQPERIKNLKPNNIKYQLTSTAQIWFDLETEEALYSIWQQGFGRVDAFGAVFEAELDSANQGMKIRKDLKGKKHYEGFSYYDEETGMFVLYDDPNAGGFGSWAGGFGSWAGSYIEWDGEYNAEVGGFGSWAGG